MRARIAVAAGDGIGAEVVPQAVKILRAVEKRFGHDFDLCPVAIGYGHWKATGVPVSEESLEICKSSQGILLGALGAPRQEGPPDGRSLGWGRQRLVSELGYSASVRPARVFPDLADATPLKPERVVGTDVVIVREAGTSTKLGVHAGGVRETERGRCCTDQLFFYEEEIVPILRFSFRLARSRRQKLTLMAQPAVFQTSRLWLQLFEETGKWFPDVQIDAMAPDNCAMQLVRNARELDVVVCDSSTMGGILNNLAGLIMGSIGMAPGATIALQDGASPDQMVVPNGTYEPIHGTAPRRAGQWIVNPIGAVLSAAMLLRYSLSLEEEAQAVERGVKDTLAGGYRTYDIMQPGKTRVGTQEMGDLIAAAVTAGSSQTHDTASASNAM